LAARPKLCIKLFDPGLTGGRLFVTSHDDIGTGDQMSAIASKPAPAPNAPWAP
jgi:hypothetical protein